MGRSEQDPPTRFTAHHAAELLWRYGIGATRVTHMSNAPSESGLRGKGHSSTKGFLGSVVLDEEAMARFGKIDRALAMVEPMERDALSLAFGDAGAAVTDRDAYPNRRWLAVASMTVVATTKGKAWARLQKPRRPKKRKDPKDIDERERDPNVGSPAIRWVNHICGLPHLRGDDLQAFQRLESEADTLLQVAKVAFARAYDRVSDDERQIERTARVGGQRR